MEDTKTKVGILNQLSSARPKSGVCVHLHIHRVPPMHELWVGSLRSREERDVVPDVQSSQLVEKTSAHWKYSIICTHFESETPREVSEIRSS